MAVIEFLPDRLNTPPVVWRGFTAGEFLLAAAVGFVLGMPRKAFMGPCGRLKRCRASVRSP